MMLKHCTMLYSIWQACVYENVISRSFDIALLSNVPPQIVEMSPN